MLLYKQNIGLLLLFLILIVSFTSCKNEDPALIIEKAIVAHGWQNYKGNIITFQQGSILYGIFQKDGSYILSRTFDDNRGQRVHDVFSNSGFSRTINNVETSVSPNDALAFSEAIKEIVLLTILPNTLKESKKDKEYIGTATIRGKHYHKVSLEYSTGSSEGTGLLAGSYLFWFHKDHYTMDYLVFVPSGENRGLFFEAVNKRNVGGIRFQDYITYTTSHRISPARLDYAFEARKLNKVSEVKLEEINVGVNY